MRHVSRTHRVDLDWLFERTDLGEAIQVKFVNTLQQTVGVATKGTFS